MRAVCFQNVRSISVDSLADPVILDPQDAIVEVSVAGLCGSDLHPFFGRETGIDPGTVMGHEFVGRVVQVGEDVKTLTTGDHVCTPFTTNCGECFYCRRGLSSRCQHGELFGWRENGSGLHGGQCERVRVPLADGTLMKIPGSMSEESALLLGDNLSTAYFGATMVVEPQTIDQDILAVVGCGNVGLLSIVCAKRLGAKRIFAIDPNESRLDIAQQLGASVYTAGEDAVAAIHQESEGRGADGVMEFVGLPDAQALAYRLVRPGGRMGVIGCHCTPHFAFSPAQAYDKNLTYRTGRCPARSLMGTLADTLFSEPLDLSWCITHRFGVDAAVDAYEVFAYRKDNCVKAVIEF